MWVRLLKTFFAMQVIMCFSFRDVVFKLCFMRPVVPWLLRAAARAGVEVGEIQEG